MGKKEESVSSKTSWKSTRCKLKFSSCETDKSKKQRSSKDPRVLKELPVSSVYEISFKSSIDFDSDSEPTKVCLADVLPLALERENKTDNVLKIFENTLIGSHYPRFPEVESESELNNIKKVDLNVQTSVSSHFLRGSKFFEGKQLIKEPTSFVEIGENEKKEIHELHLVSSKKTVSVTADNKQMPSVMSNFIHKAKYEEETEKETVRPIRMNRKVKKKMIKSFFSNNTSALPSSSFIKSSDSDKELVHIHHHEHHHHYHFDRNAKRSEPPIGGKNSLAYAPKPNITIKKRNLGKCKKVDEDKSKSAYYYVCESGSSVTFKRNLYCPEEFCEVFKTIRSCSIESLTNQKSDLLKTHNYSDSELTKCSSDDYNEKDCKANHLSAINSFKSLNRLPSKIVQMKSSVMNEGAPNDNEQKGATSAEKDADDIFLRLPKIQSEDSFDRNTDIDTQQIISKKKSDEKKEQTEGFLLHEWAEKIKTELKEMKKELQVIEKEFFNTNTDISSQSNFSNLCVEKSQSKLKPEGGSDPAISIFSSKTFILRAENFYVMEETDSESFGEIIREPKELKDATETKD